MIEMTNTNIQKLPNNKLTDNKLTENIIEIEAMAQELEAYIVNQKVYRTMLVSVAAGNRQLEMSGGDLLARINQLKEHREDLSPVEQKQLQTIDANVQRTIYSLRTPFHELLRRELKSRYDQLAWNLGERLDHEKPDVAEIGNRQRIAVIQQELDRPAI